MAAVSRPKNDPRKTKNCLRLGMEDRNFARITTAIHTSKLKQSQAYSKHFKVQKDQKALRLITTLTTLTTLAVAVSQWSLRQRLVSQPASLEPSGGHMPSQSERCPEDAKLRCTS